MAAQTHFFSRRHRLTLALVMKEDLVFLLRVRKLFGGARGRKASAGRRQRQADGQPPAGAGQAAAHGLPFVVLHMQVCVSHRCSLHM